MSDPHIDIDEIDAAASMGTQPGQSREPGIGNTVESGYDMGNLFTNMTRQFQRWGNDFSLLPPETSRHLRASQREFLLAWRSMIDNTLEKLERQDMRDQLKNDPDLAGGNFRRGAQKIEVEDIED